MEQNTYITTKRIRVQGKALAMIIPHDWPFKAGDDVEISVCGFGDSKEHHATRKVYKTGTSLCVYCNKSWGIERDEMVIFKMRLDGDVKDAGRKIETRDSGVSKV